MKVRQVPEKSIDAARQAFYSKLPAQHLAPLWEVLHSLVTPEPNSPAEPALWRYDHLRSFLFEAGDLISAEEAERRVLILENPALAGQSRITRTLYAGLQLILPGEVARCHRHTQSALRFVMEGEGAFTAVGGEKAYMSRWDLILTPNWIWHDHGNESAGAMVWLDGLDIPLVTALDASFAELLQGRTAHPESSAPGATLDRFGANMRPVGRPSRVAEDPARLFVYPYSRWREALERMYRNEHPDAHDGLKMEFINPADGSSVMPTISAYCQLIPDGFGTAAIRATDGTVYVVVEGSGTADVGSSKFNLKEGDVFVVPSWVSRQFDARGGNLVMFAYSDKATQERLGLWRESLVST